MSAAAGDSPKLDAALQRYSRQILVPQIGVHGQKMLRNSRVAVVGVGALGGALANTLVRAGVGFVRLIDRDFIELDNLQRQVLFDEHDLKENLPKAEAAARRLRRVNSQVELEPVVDDLRPANAEALLTEVDLLLDGTDNLETRYLVNDVAVKHGLPWIYGAVLATEGRAQTIVPGASPCLRCVFETPPGPGELPTCDTAGVLASAVQVVAAIQATEALKLLTDRGDERLRGLVSVETWALALRSTFESLTPRADCPCCGGKRFDFLEGGATGTTVRLCGRNAVQLLPPESVAKVDLGALARRLPSGSRPQQSPYLLRFQAEQCQFTLFPDGRAIIQGTTDEAKARGLYARFVGT